MILRPEVQQFLDVLNRQLIPAAMAQGFKPNVINAREALAGLTFKYLTRQQAVAAVWDDTIAGDEYSVPVRLYHPDPQQALPVLVYFHGGGGVVGSVSVYDQILRRLAVHTRHIVVAPEYRLAPENPYPAAQSDALTVLAGVRGLLAGRGLAFTDRVVVAGDSAGGSICANLFCCTDAARFGIAAQVLVYPSVDFTMSQASVREFGEGYLLTAERMAWYFDQYFHRDADRRTASPLHREIVRPIPPTLVFTAAADPLRDEGRAYVDKLQRAGIVCRHIEVAGVIHAFLNMEDLHPEVCGQVYRDMAAFLDDLAGASAPASASP